MSRPIVGALFGSGAKSKVVQLLYLRKQDSEPLPARPLAREAGVPLGTTLAHSDIDVLVLEASDADRFSVMAALAR